MVEDREIQAYKELRAIVAKLRAPNGCPWDREQTHASLRPYLLQETYEVLAALDEGDLSALPDELGDLLWQILIHTQLAEEAGEYRMLDILEAISTKLVNRHPHVFRSEPDAEKLTAKDVEDRWEALKQAGREERRSVVEDVPEAMPALALAQELLRRAAGQGFAWPDRGDVLQKLAEELEELSAVEDARERTEEFGDLLLNVANYARYIGVDAEEALRLASRKFRRRFQRVEELTASTEKAMAEMSPEELIALWDEAKRGE